MEFHMQVQRDNWEETFSEVVTMLEGIRVDYYGAKPPDSALETFRQAGSDIRIKPTHLAGFTRDVGLVRQAQAHRREDGCHLIPQLLGVAAGSCHQYHEVVRMS
jgi:hypothetical protein